jgi:carbamoyl-phosphate synthase large subunit
MPKRTDISTILIIGAGPIVIGQACEFDYSGTQACKALKAEGYRIVLVNSNPATIMTDPDLAHATYIEPITPEVVEKIIEKERTERPGEKLVLLPTMGGQTALNTALTLNKRGVLKKWDVEMIGARAEAIDKAEDRDLFRTAMTKIGLSVPKSAFVNTSDLKQRFEKEYEDGLAAAAHKVPTPPTGSRPSGRRPNPCAARNTASPPSCRRWKPSSSPACRQSSAPRSRWAAPAAASPTRWKSSTKSS